MDAGLIVWPPPFTSPMTLTLYFQGQILKYPYLRNGGHIDMGWQGWGPLCDLKLWLWPWIYNMKFWKSLSQEKDARLTWNRRDWVDRMLDPLCEVLAMTLTLTLTLIFKGKFDKSISQEWNGLLTGNERDISLRKSHPLCDFELFDSLIMIMTLNLALSNLELWPQPWHWIFGFSRSNFETLVLQVWNNGYETKGISLDRMMVTLCDLTHDFDFGFSRVIKFWKWLYLRNHFRYYFSAWQIIFDPQPFGLETLLDPHCDFELWLHPWPWPLIFKVKFWKSCNSWMGCPIDIERKGWVHWMLDPCCDFQLWPHPWPWPWIFNVKFWNSCIPGMGGLIGMEQRHESIGCYTYFVTLSYDLDVRFSRSNFENAVSQEWEGRLTWNQRDVSR